VVAEQEDGRFAKFIIPRQEERPFQAGERGGRDVIQVPDRAHGEVAHDALYRREDSPGLCGLFACSRRYLIGGKEALAREARTVENGAEKVLEGDANADAVLIALQQGWRRRKRWVTFQWDKRVRAINSLTEDQLLLVSWHTRARTR
jgi:hypothetical protein